MDTLVMSGAPAIFADGAEGQVRLNRRGELGVMDYRQLMKQAGQMFQVSNAAKQTALASGCTAYANPTIAALSQHNEVCGGIMAMDVATSPSLAGNMLELTSEFLPILVGPASFQIYTFAGTTQPSWFYRIVWGEMASIYVK